MRLVSGERALARVGLRRRPTGDRFMIAAPALQPFVSFVRFVVQNVLGFWFWMVSPAETDGR